LGFAGVVGAEDRAGLNDPFEITADRIDYDGVRQLYIATGQVRVEQTARSLVADWVAFSTETRIGVAEGGVELIDGRDVLQAEFMVFDVDSLQGMLFEGGIDAGAQGFKIRAEEMIRTGKNRFQMRDGIFTTCRCPDGERLPWHIRARDAKVELGGYGTVKNATFEVLGVPVLWVP
jgi:lipopolysaccharide assembly outer membrane protein LptD (OstA)